MHTNTTGPRRRASLRSLLGPFRTLAILAALLLSGTVLPAPARADEAKPVLFLAAASLQTALNRIATDWQHETGKRVTFSYAASSTLARQIEAGAPADLFASADLDWMDWAQSRKLIRDDTRRVLLGNRLVLVTQADAASALTIGKGFPLAAALGDTRLAIGDPKFVPAGHYAVSALTALGVWAQIASRTVGAENVRAALLLVARGEARYGVVYETDAHSEKRVRIVGAFPAETHPPIVYPFAITARSANPDASAFLNFLASPGAAKVFEGEGFSILK